MITLLTLASTGAYDGRWDGPPWPAFFLIPLLFGTILVLGFVLWRGCRGSAVSIVAQRYARGEIDEDEYRRRVSELRAK